MKERDSREPKELSREDFLLRVDNAWEYWANRVEEGEFGLQEISKIVTKANRFEHDDKFKVKYLEEADGSLRVEIKKKGKIGFIK